MNSIRIVFFDAKDYDIQSFENALPVFREAFPYALLFGPAGTETGETEGIGYILQPNEILDFEKQAEKNCLAVRVDPDDAEMVCFAALHHVAGFHHYTRDCIKK